MFSNIHSKHSLMMQRFFTIPFSNLPGIYKNSCTPTLSSSYKMTHKAVIAGMKAVNRETSSGNRDDFSRSSAPPPSRRGMTTIFNGKEGHGYCIIKARAAAFPADILTLTVQPSPTFFYNIFNILRMTELLRGRYTRVCCLRLTNELQKKVQTVQLYRILFETNNEKCPFCTNDNFTVYLRQKYLIDQLVVGPMVSRDSCPPSITIVFIRIYQLVLGLIIKCSAVYKIPSESLYYRSVRFEPMIHHYIQITFWVEKPKSPMLHSSDFDEFILNEVMNLSYKIASNIASNKNVGCLKKLKNLKQDLLKFNTMFSISFPSKNRNRNRIYRENLKRHYNINVLRSFIKRGK
ncbi:hypothetical protein AGLY_009144 [Aphis glycines]|uniref:Uncharacterized protein n=1 Tax=Aphis glycines TaxID=307491 RepID=A0A6G0TIG6_APHGL|nr:hypothetical protein AGLY_009144 [Aphis glycines]